MQHLPALNTFVQREIAYHIANGDWLRDDVTTEDLVAAIVARARRELDSKPPGRDFRGWLLSLADEEIVAQLRQARRHHDDFFQDLSQLPGVPTPEQIIALHIGRRREKSQDEAVPAPGFVEGGGGGGRAGGGIHAVLDEKKMKKKG